MKALLNKELRLAMHPTAPLFLALSALILVPNYPYYVTFFYTCLGIFFICLTGRENQDLFFTLLLPVEKSDLVRARMAAACLLQLAQGVTALAALLARQALDLPGNLAGMDANLAFLGLSYGMLGLFNLVFFPAYFGAPNRVGLAFLKGCAALAVYMLIAEGLTFTVPFFRDVLDTPALWSPEKGLVLAAGLAVYGLLTWLAFGRSRRRFERLDL